MRRTAISTRSRKLAGLTRIYRKRADIFLSRNPWCWRHLLMGVRAAAVCVHHRAGRNHRLLDERWWAASCDPCNIFAEVKTGAAREEKWLLSFISPERDDDGRYERFRDAA